VPAIGEVEQALMPLLVVWFIMTNGTGYLAPQDVDAAALHCALAGAVPAGVSVDRPVNPLLARWPDPKSPEQHCAVDISLRVAALEPGEYWLATTEMGQPFEGALFVGPDPHTSDPWLRSVTDPGLPGPPVNFRISGDPHQ
jgi:hypothetical protein